MNASFSFLRYHWPALCLAVLFGITVAFPLFWYKTELGAEFKGIWPGVVNDQQFYLARIQEVRDAGITSGNAYLAEHKDTPPVQIMLPEYLLSIPLELFGLTTALGFLLYSLVLPPIIFLLAYAVGIRCGGGRLSGLIAAIFLCFGPLFSLYVRPVSPQFNLLFLLSAFLVFFQIDTMPRRAWIFLNAVLFGALFYVYPYYWTYMGAVYGVAGILFLFFKEYALVRQIGWAVFGGVVIGSGSLYQMALARTLPFFDETMTRLGLVYTHLPSGFLLVLLSGAVLALAVFLRKKNAFVFDTKSTLGAAAVAGGVLAMNQHLLTGQNLEFSSHYKVQILFAIIFFLLLLWRQMKENISPSLRALALTITLLFGSWSVVSTHQSTLATLKEGGERVQQYAGALEWLRENAKPGEVVYADDGFSTLVPIYTSLDVVYTRNANFFFMSDDEVIDRFLTTNYFMEITPQFISDHERELFGVRFIDRYAHAAQWQKLSKLFGAHAVLPERLPAELAPAVLARARIIQGMNFEDVLRKYNARFVVVSRQEKETHPLLRKNFSLSFQDNALAVYSRK